MFITPPPLKVRPRLPFVWLTASLYVRVIQCFFCRQAKQTHLQFCCLVTLISVSTTSSRPLKAKRLCCFFLFLDTNTDALPGRPQNNLFGCKKAPLKMTIMIYVRSEAHAKITSRSNHVSNIVVTPFHCSLSNDLLGPFSPHIHSLFPPRLCFSLRSGVCFIYLLFSFIRHGWGLR